MTNSLTGFVYDFLPIEDGMSQMGTLVIEQGRRREKSAKIALRVKRELNSACAKLKKNDYVQVTFKIISYPRRGDKGDYWITVLYVREIITLG